MDQHGRVVVPKAIRDRLGLRAGSKLQVEEHDGVVELSSQASERYRPVRRSSGVLAAEWIGEGPPPEIDVRRAVEDGREERMRQVLGLDT